MRGLLFNQEEFKGLLGRALKYSATVIA